MFSSKRSLRGERFRRRFFVGLSRPFSQRDFAFLAGGGANAARSGGDFVFVSAGFFAHFGKPSARFRGRFVYRFFGRRLDDDVDFAKLFRQQRVVARAIARDRQFGFCFAAADLAVRVFRRLRAGVGCARALRGGGGVGGGLVFRRRLSPAAPWAVLYFAAMGALLAGALGIVAGLWAEKFDQMALFQNFVIMPLTFLSGVFYSLASLPPLWRTISQGNPFFYMIDGFRHGFFGQSDEGLGAAFLFTTAGALAACAWAWRLVAIGYKTRS